MRVGRTLHAVTDAQGRVSPPLRGGYGTCRANLTRSMAGGEASSLRKSPLQADCNSTPIVAVIVPVAVGLSFPVVIAVVVVVVPDVGPIRCPFAPAGRAKQAKYDDE